MQWSIEADVFKFIIALKDRPCTRRGILSTVSSIFDPLGFVAPVLLEGKSILQELCRKNLGWDDPVPEEIRIRWCKWKSELEELEALSISRCYKPKDFGSVVRHELHHFSDATFKGYSQCSYLRMVNAQGKVHCSFVIGKSRVTPLKAVTVPRLELTAAVVSVKVSEQLRRELDMLITQEFFWTDSQVVLGYIGNEVRRFHVFVANRVQQIQESSSVDQWMYVDTKQNPADEGSRGLRPSQLASSKWINGPDFLWKDEVDWVETRTMSNEIPVLSENDPEVKKVVSLATTVEAPFATLLERLSFFSDWERAKKALALCCRYMRCLRNKVGTKRTNEGYDLRRKSKRVRPVAVNPVSVEELRQAELVIIKTAQHEGGLDILNAGPLVKLDPYRDSNGVIRVGGRLQLANLTGQCIHPAVLPRDSPITKLVVRYYHERAHHQGKGITLNEIRASGYWILGASSVVSKVISQCVTCKLRGSVQKQHMAVLPPDCLEPAPPFTSCAVDYFGPFIIKERRKELKRYGVLFTCMASRAVHIEVAASLETDSFINALRRFLSRRGPIRQLRSDQGTNFVGAKRELKEALKELNGDAVRKELLRNNCDWFEFKMNVPSASHMGGVWERQIRTVRNVLSAILERNGSQLNDEALTTFMCEAEAIVNSRPLTVDSINDPKSPNPLTPNHLLTMKTKVLLPPPGVFQSADMYCKRRWRRVQHLANEFWIRWRKEYMLTLQERQKWNRPRRNSKVGDIVLIRGDGEVSRNQWQLARVGEVKESADGYVRSVKLLVADGTLDNKGKRTKPASLLDHPVQKLVLLHEAEEEV